MRPAVILHVRNFQPLCSGLLGEYDHLLQPIKIAPVNDHIYRKRDAPLANHLRDAQFERVAARTGEFVCRRLLIILEAQLDVIETGADELVQPAFIEANSGGDQI